MRRSTDAEVFVNKAGAIEDLREIGRYTQKRWGREQRRHYLAPLDRCFRPLAENPNQGQRCDEIRSGYRKFPSGQHIVFYCEQNTGGIEIIRVLHERMDVGFPGKHG